MVMPCPRQEMRGWQVAISRHPTYVLCWLVSLVYCGIWCRFEEIYKEQKYVLGTINVKFTEIYVF